MALQQICDFTEIALLVINVVVRGIVAMSCSRNTEVRIGHHFKVFVTLQHLNIWIYQRPLYQREDWSIAWHANLSWSGLKRPSIFVTYGRDRVRAVLLVGTYNVQTSISDISRNSSYDLQHNKWTINMEGHLSSGWHLLVVMNFGLSCPVFSLPVHEI